MKLNLDLIIISSQSAPAKMCKSPDKVPAGTVLTLIVAVYYLLIAVVSGGGGGGLLNGNGNESIGLPPPAASPKEQFSTPENVVLAKGKDTTDAHQILEELYIGFLAGYSHSKVIN